MEYKFIIDKIPPSLDNIMEFIESDSIGAIYFFIGKVRNTNNSKDVEYLEYEVDKDTGIKLMDNNLKKYKNDIKNIFIFQAEGKLKPGENTIIIAASSYGRKQAIKCVNELVEFMKHNFPVWKKEYYRDSTFVRL